jgi:cardiolipin synthase A/B
VSAVTTFTSHSVSFHLLRSGEQALNRMLETIRAAQQSIRLEMYIYTAGGLGTQFRDALEAASRRGIEVRVMVDALGSLTLPESFWNPLKAAGGQFRWFNRLRLGHLACRDHRKIFICDRQMAIIGGYNIATEYCGDGVKTGWRDLGMQLHGPLVEALTETFDRQFELADRQQKPFVRLRRAATRNRIITTDGELLLTGPGRGFNYLVRAILSDLANATSVQIICAYFLPPRSFRRALRQVVRRGGRVQIILPGKSDVNLSRLAAHGFYQRLLDAGVEIYEYQPQILHAKLFLFNNIVYVGSANLDTRSLSINYELMVRLHDEPLAAEAEEIFQTDLGYSRRIDPQVWSASRTFWKKLKERWAYFILARVDPYIAQREMPAIR